MSEPSAIDRSIETASIEDYIMALPPFEFHEESVEQFRQRIRAARSLEDGADPREQDAIFVGGDGSWPAREFSLDRASHTLRIDVGPGEGESPPCETTMRRVPGGWMRGPTVPKTTNHHDEVRGSRTRVLAFPEELQR